LYIVGEQWVSEEIVINLPLNGRRPKRVGRDFFIDFVILLSPTSTFRSLKSVVNEWWLIGDNK